jgi:hypothetical protein
MPEPKTAFCQLGRRISSESHTAAREPKRFRVLGERREVTLYKDGAMLSVGNERCKAAGS